MVGVGANNKEGVVLEMEHRRKSGRGVREWFFLPSAKSRTELAELGSERRREVVILLEDHPDYRSPEREADGEVSSVSPPCPCCRSDRNADHTFQNQDAQKDSTFELGLSERQRQDRDGVVLPYFDAQKGGGDGGRILYDMGSEDDFDEEEDEV